MKKFVILFYLGLKNQHLTKDVGLTAFYANKICGFDSKIITPFVEKESYPDVKSIEGVEITSFKGKSIGLIHFGLIKYLLKNSKKIDILNLFHFSLPSLVYGLIYKIRNKNGNLYLRLDYNVKLFQENGNKIYNINPMINRLLRPFENLMIRICNIISVEAKEGIVLLNNYNRRFEKKLICMPNGADDINIKEQIKDIRTFEAKENMIITVGRIGSYQKNTEILLDIIKDINLKEWKVKIIGPIEDSFLPQIDIFFEKNPNLKSIVEFTGPKKKTEVYEYYNKAKIFVLTSRREGFANIYPEALYFGNHIITTDVSGANDITNNGIIGDMVNVEDNKGFSNKVQKYIENPDLLKEKYEKARKHSNDYFVLSKIIKDLNKLDR